MPKPYVSPVEIAHFRFALIAPVIQCTYSEPSASAYYRRVVCVNLKVPLRGCGQKPGLDIIARGAVCFPTKKELRLSNY